LGVGLLAAQVVAAQLRSIALSVEAEAVADTVEARIEGMLRPEDLQRPMSADTVGVSLWRGDGVVNYSTDSALVGRSAKSDDMLALALAGEPSKEIKPRSEVGLTLAQGTGDVMEVYVPLRLGGPKVVG